ncbi:multiheme c-type cytochrome [Planctomycetota bacterium]
MKYIRVTLGLILLAGLCGVLWMIRAKAGKPIEQGNLAPLAPSGKSPFKTTDDCRPCHLQIYEEWEYSLHALAVRDQIFLLYGSAVGTNPEEGNPECVFCHTPAPVLEGTIGRYPRSRPKENDPASGVNCLSCHVMGENVAGTQGLSGPCNPVKTEIIGSPAFCGSCHQNQQVRMIRKHEWEEWRERSKKTENLDCVDCHMAPVKRSIAEGGEVRTGHKHDFNVIRNPEFLRTAFDVDMQVIDRQVVLAISNKGTGHKLPTGYRIRNLRFIAWVDGEDSKAEEPLWREVYGLKRQSQWGGGEYPTRRL